MSSGFLDARIVQVHPTLRCNLACAHCYSSSGPRMRGELPADMLLARLTRLRAEGYDVVSFSGGEPLMYSAFDEVAAGAKEMGFRINLITNGLLLTPKRVARLADTVSVLGLSLDGAPERHDRMRGLDGAFERVSEKLSLLRDHDIAFGFAHCVTSESIEDLPWLLAYALEQGARLLQLHPLTMAGRATSSCGSMALSAADLARVFVIAELLRIQAGGALIVQLDIAALPQVLAHRKRHAILAMDDAEDTTDRPLAELVNPIILDETGDLFPMAYGIDNSQRIAGGSTSQCSEGIAAYKRTGTSALRRLLNAAFAALEDESPEFVDWYGHVVNVSHQLRPNTLSLPISA
ncbi:MAG: radical SAM protein [Nannocystaceae bacterium]|nr:radical SAM protein [Nannocystaceae bacterium]